jgi:hypothetical protein
MVGSLLEGRPQTRRAAISNDKRSKMFCPPAIMNAGGLNLTGLIQRNAMGQNLIMLTKPAVS